MRRDSLCLPGSLQHKKLGQDGDRLQEDRKRPENLSWSEFIVEEQGKKDAGSNKVFYSEGVDGGVVCWSEAELHEIENVAAARYEEDLHDKVVE